MPRNMGKKTFTEQQYAVCKQAKNKTDVALSSFGFQLATTELNRIGLLVKYHTKMGLSIFKAYHFQAYFLLKIPNPEYRLLLLIQ